MRRLWHRIKNHFVPSHHNAYRPHLLRRRALVTLLAVALVAEGVLVANLLARQSGYTFLAAVIQSEIVLLTNQERADNNLGALAENTQLDVAAQAKANDMATKGYFAHNSPDGRVPWDFVSATGYDYRYAGENLAVRFVDSKDVVNAWMASPTHRANIVKPVYTQIGVAVAQGMYQGQPATFVVQYFGTPRFAAAPALAPPVARAAPAAQAPTTTAVLGEQAPAPVATAVSDVAPVPPPPQEAASLTQSLARQAGRLLSEPRATTMWILGVIILLLGAALAFAFFHHIQIQAHDLLLPGTLVVVVALTLVVINNNALPDVIHDTQAASVANAILLP
jgi:hypothetical protein